MEAITESSAQILAEGGYPAFNTNAVARRAGVSVGTVYQYFPNREAAARLSAKGDEKRVYELLYSELEALFEAHRDKIKITDFRLGSFVVANIVESTLHAVLANRPEDVELNSLKRELVRAVLGYLSTEPNNYINPAVR